MTLSIWKGPDAGVITLPDDENWARNATWPSFVPVNNTHTHIYIYIKWCFDLVLCCRSCTWLYEQFGADSNAFDSDFAFDSGKPCLGCILGLPFCWKIDQIRWMKLEGRWGGGGGANIRLLCGLLNIRCHFYKKTERAVKFCLKCFGWESCFVQSFLLQFFFLFFGSVF